MDLLIHGKWASTLGRDFDSSLQEWGYHVISVDSSTDVEKYCSQINRPSILFIDLQSAENLTTFVFENYEDHPLFLFLVDSEPKEGSILRAFDLGAHDTIELPLNVELLKRKLKLARDRVLEHEAFIETSNVLQRYSEHIDQVAEERARQLVHAERLSTLGIMSAGIAHEINTPIAYMSSSLEMARLYWDKLAKEIDPNQKFVSEGDEQFKKALERIPKALERIDHGLAKVVRLTNSLKNFGRSSRNERSPCSLNECVEEALELAEHALKPDVQVETNLARELPLIDADSQQMEQVLINLFVNASHALEEQDDRRLWVTTEVDGDMVKVVVLDNGPGIPEDHLPNIWNAFFTTKKVGKGTGLGLAISKGIIRDHSGSIEVTNPESGGARFEIRIPISKQDKLPAD